MECCGSTQLFARGSEISLRHELFEEENKSCVEPQHSKIKLRP